MLCTGNELKVIRNINTCTIYSGLMHLQCVTITGNKTSDGIYLNRGTLKLQRSWKPAWDQFHGFRSRKKFSIKFTFLKTLWRFFNSFWLQRFPCSKLPNNPTQTGAGYPTSVLFAFRRQSNNIFWGPICTVNVPSRPRSTSRYTPWSNPVTLI